MRVVIVDDEPPARRKIRRFLGHERDVQIVAEASDGASALEAIGHHQPDLVFLDVQMPGVDGFGVLAALPEAEVPHVVFVTAYDEYAIKAFEVSAVDYLLKPFDEERLQASLVKVRERLRLERHADVDGRFDRLLQELRRENQTLDRILVKTAGRVLFVDTRDIAWIEGAGNYVKLHVKHQAHLLRETLDRLGARLDPRIFVRAHKSHLVNVEHIREMYHWSHGDYMIVMRDGTELKLSRRYREKLPEEFRERL